MGRKDKNADDQQMEVSGFTGMMMTIFFAVDVYKRQHQGSCFLVLNTSAGMPAGRTPD